jgi:hypothetical protein
MVEDACRALFYAGVAVVFFARILACFEGWLRKAADEVEDLPVGHIGLVAIIAC